MIFDDLPAYWQSETRPSWLIGECISGLLEFLKDSCQVLLRDAETCIGDTHQNLVVRFSCLTKNMALFSKFYRIRKEIDQYLY